MRIVFVIICSFLLNAVNAQTSLAKTKWAAIQRKLWADLDSGKINSEEWYQRIRVEAGSLGMSFQAWFVSKTTIAETSQRENEITLHKGVAVLIPNKFQVIKDNGNRYIQLFLVNNSDTTVNISRNDATVLDLSCYVRLSNEWILLRGTPIVPCGNTAFTETLLKKTLMTIELDNADQGDGDSEVPFKVKFQMNDRLIESNEIQIKLHINQINRLLEENEILKQNQKKFMKYT